MDLSHMMERSFAHSTTISPKAQPKTGQLAYMIIYIDVAAYRMIQWPTSSVNIGKKNKMNAIDDRTQAPNKHHEYSENPAFIHWTIRDILVRLRAIESILRKQLT